MDLDHTSRKRRIWRNAAILFVLIAGLHFFQVSVSNRLVLGGNEGAHVKLLHSMVVRGTLAIDPPADVSFYKGRHYSNKPPGFPMVLAPAYAGYVAVSGKEQLDDAFYFAKYANALISAGAVVLIYLLLSSFSLSLGAVLFGVAAATTGTIFPAYSCLANSLPLSIFLCVGVLLAARQAQLQPGSMSSRTIVLFGGSLAIAVDYANAFFLMPVLIWVATGVLKRHELPALLAGLIPAALVLSYNAVAFEDPFAISYAYYQPPSADGSRGGVFWVNVQNRGVYRTHIMESLFLHEALPGHHFQHAVAQGLSELPRFRPGPARRRWPWRHLRAPAPPLRPASTPAGRHQPQQAPQLRVPGAPYLPVPRRPMMMKKPPS